ncbi:MAG: hypothetical protein CMM93_06710 [Rickettsiales bacterium]|nr:hypothetical protein [Rickettsiales bacterium]
MLAEDAFIDESNLEPDALFLDDEEKEAYGNGISGRIFQVGVEYNLGKFVPEKYSGIYEEESRLLKPMILRDQIQGELKYVRDKSTETSLIKEMRAILHNGQRKLFICELHHLCENIDSLDEEVIVIAAGSAPSNKSYEYIKRFKKVKFIFIDPREFNIYVNRFHESHYKYPGLTLYFSVNQEMTNVYKYRNKTIRYYQNGEIKVGDLTKLDFKSNLDEAAIDHILASDCKIFLFNEYMTRELSQSLNSLIQKWGKKVLFWSDIRTAEGGVGMKDQEVEDSDILSNAAMNYIWLKELIKGVDKDFFAMLKFRLPYDGKLILNDFAKKQLETAEEMGGHFLPFQEKYMKWFQGKVYLQAYAGYKSAESRLWCNLEDLRAPLKNWSLEEHEGKLFKYNVIQKLSQVFENPHSSEKIGFDHCGDCAIQSYVYNLFFTKFLQLKGKKLTKKVQDLVVKIGSITNRRLNVEPHGHLFPKPNRADQKKE